MCLTPKPKSPPKGHPASISVESLPLSSSADSRFHVRRLGRTRTQPTRHDKLPSLHDHAFGGTVWGEFFHNFTTLAKLNSSDSSTLPIENPNQEVTIERAADFSSTLPGPNLIVNPSRQAKPTPKQHVT